MTDFYFKQQDVPEGMNAYSFVCWYVSRYSQTSLQLIVCCVKLNYQTLDLGFAI